MNRRKLNKLCKGFSITEMSVVLASVTAIVVFTAGGMVMMNKAQINNVIDKISYFSTAIEEFEQEYGALPGDIANVDKLPGATGGNGNGTIDSDQEALNLWNHLTIAGLVDGHYNGLDENEVGVGVPSADIEGGGYNIKQPDSISYGNISKQSIVIELSGFNKASGDNDLSILTPEDARAIDEKADDGNPTTGYILAEDGKNQTGQCVSGTDYNLTNISASCRLLFIVRKSRVIDDSNPITGECVEVGQTREVSDINEKCPDGYEGKILETCRVNESNEGLWEITDRVCEEVRCSGGQSVGDRRNIACVNGMKGNQGIEQICTQEGIWVATGNSDCEYTGGSSCSIESEGDTKEAKACELGQTGFIIEECTSGEWTENTNTCEEIKCGALNSVGDTRTVSGNCPFGYIGGDIVQVCSIAGTWETTSIGSECVPDYSGAGCTPDSTKDIGCAPGQTGQHTLVCIAANTNYYTTQTNTCKPIQCSGGYNIGASRVKEGATCPGGVNGTVMEYCKQVGDKGIWTEVRTNCVTGVCDATDGLVGNAIWPTVTGDNWANHASCAEGYIEGSTAPTRYCDIDGNWSNTANNPCIRRTCPAIPYNSSNPEQGSYPQVDAGEIDVKGVCDHADYEGAPSMNCKMDGTWDTANEKFPCTNVGSTSCPIYSLPVTGVQFWVDAAEECKVFSDSCNGTAAIAGSDTVACIMDKSGNGHHATQSSSASRPVYTSAASGKNNLPTLRFDGSNDALRFPNIGTFSTTTAFVVHKEDLYNSDGHCMLCRSGGTYTSIYTDFYFSSAYPGRTRNYVQGRLPKKITSSYYTAGIYNISTMFDDNETGVTYKNGLIVASDGITTSQNKQWGPGNIGVYSSDGINYNDYLYDGNIGEIAIYNSAISTGQRQNVQEYLEDKWNITTFSLIRNAAFWVDASDSNTAWRKETCFGPKANPGSHTIGCIEDKSGNNNHATQANSSYRPQYTSGITGKNGLPTIQFDGSNDALRFPDIGTFSTTTAFVVHKEDLYNSNGHCMLCRGGGTYTSIYTEFYFSSAYPGRTRNFVYDRLPKKVTSSLYTAGTYNVSAMRDDNINGTSYRNGSVVASDVITTPQDKQWGPGHIGTWSSDGVTPDYYLYNGNIAEIIIFDSALSKTDREYIESYLGSKWDITISH